MNTAHVKRGDEVVVIAGTERPLTPPALVMALLFTLHYLNRALVFPFRLRTPGKRMPLVIMLLAVGFNLVNGSLLGWQPARRGNYTLPWLTDPRFVAGLVLFLGGMAVNWWADRRLINLRRPGELGYVIPRGGLFEVVSCPNHLGEIVEWSGFALMTWSLPGLGFAFWTAANLVPRSLAHHRWYRQTFKVDAESLWRADDSACTTCCFGTSGGLVHGCVGTRDGRTGGAPAGGMKRLSIGSDSREAYHGHGFRCPRVICHPQYHQARATAPTRLR